MKNCSFFLLVCALVGRLLAAETIDPWRIDSGPIDPKNYFGETVGNGMIGLLSAPAPFGTQQVLVNGAYEAIGWSGVSALVPSFDFLKLSFLIDGERIDRLEQVMNFRQTLDLKKATFTTSFEVQDKATVSYSVRALRQLPFAGLLEVSIEAKRPIVITPMSLLAAPGNLTELKAPPAFHEYTGADSARNIFAASAKGPLGALTLAAAHQFVFEDSAYDAPIVTRHSDGLLFVKSLAAGSTFHFGLVDTTITSAHVADPYNEAQRLAAYGATLGLSQLRSAHASAWAKLWKGDIRIDGDNAIQRDVHAMLYHLYSFIRAGTSYSISPMGLSRSTGGYLGHIFWDAEFWMFPTLLALQPDLARSMLDYRFARLDAARRNATFHGYRGAMFPWESAASGEEDTPSPAVSGMLEIHITADIGIAAWNYYRATQDRDWLRENGYPIIRDTAEFWTSRVERNGPANFSILGVVAADEYAANVDNNAFTNAAARENLAAATAAAKVLGLAPDPDWETVRRNIPILVFPDGTTREHATYTGEKVKQADVNLLAFPLQTITDAAAIRRDLEYYYQRIDHDRGPAMTKSVFAVLWQRLGEPERALAMFKSGYQLNERPPFGVLAEAAYTSNPYFCTGAGGLLQTMIYGFGGLELTDHGFEHHPELLPAAWRSVILTGIGPQREDFEVRNSRATSSPAARNN